MKYNELWGKECESNKFNYHIQKLVDSELIIKEKEDYCLTNKGKTIVTHLDGVTGDRKQKPVVCSFILGYMPDKKKILVNLRKKEPFYGYVGIPGGKIDFGISPKKTAEEEFLEETGLVGDMKLKVVSNYNTYNDGELMHHLIAFTYVCENPSGSLIKENREGKNMWIDIKELENHSRYPDIDELIDKSLSVDAEVKFLNLNRWQKNGLFVDMKVLKEF
tara:strand:+ start:89 stop:745 length:657 start_codon:yes stop_codon:yes gene_type:complete